MCSLVVSSLMSGVFVHVNVLQEVEFLTSSIGQLKVVQTKYVEAKDSMNVMNQKNKGEY